MFTQRLLSPAIQTAGRSIACSTPEVLQNVRNYNRDHNQSLLEGYSNQNIIGKFSSQFRRIAHGSFVKVVTRNFGNSTQHFIREFSPQANESTHNILCSLPDYIATTVSNIQHSLSTEDCNQISKFFDQSKDISLDQVITKFQTFSRFCDNPNIIGDGQCISFLLESLIKQKEVLTFPQLLDILNAAKLCQSALTNNDEFEIFLKEMEDYCARQIRKWTFTQSLLIADYWYVLSKSSNYYYLTRLLKTNTPYVKLFSQTQFVQYMFYSNVLGNLGFLSNVIVQLKLKQFIYTLSTSEIGIICMALFKSSNMYNTLQHGMLTQFAGKLIAEKDITPDEMIVPILKCLNRGNLSEKFYLSLFDAFLGQINKHNSFVQLHFCHMASSKGIYHKEFIDKLLNGFVENLPSLRLKDIERYIYAVMVFNLGKDHHENIFPLIVEELRKPERVTEFNHFPHVFVSCITHLSAAGVYPLDLVSAVFQPSMLQYLKDPQVTSSYQDIFRSVIELSWALLIEGPPNYIGYQLDEGFRDELTKKYSSPIPTAKMLNLSKNEKKIIALNESLSTFLETGSSSIVNILPQFSSPVLVFCTNSKGDAVEIPESYFEQSELHVKLPVHVDDGVRWNAVISACKSLLIKPQNYLKGNLVHKIRLLETLGYSVSLAKSVPENLGIAKKNLYLKETLCNSTFNMDKKTFITDVCVPPAMEAISS